jgi:hypothetical protein
MEFMNAKPRMGVFGIVSKLGKRVFLLFFNPAKGKPMRPGRGIKF